MKSATTPLSRGRWRRAFAHVFGVGLLLMLSQSALANERWDRHKGNCDQVFGDPRGHDLEQLRTCTKRWEMYRDVADVDRSLRARMHTALDHLYGQGTKADQMIALSAMKRLGVRQRAIAEGEQGLRREGTDVMVVSSAGRAAAPAAPAALTPGIDPNAPAIGEYGERPPDRQRATQHYRQGVNLYQGRSIEAALGEFLQSADADPTWAKPLYLAAACYTEINMPEDAIATLKQMREINSDEARRLVKRASEDDAFKKLRSRPSFKSLTGSAVVQLLNGAGGGAASKVAKMAKTLEAKGLPVANIGTDSNSRVSTYIYRKPGFERQADAVRRTLRLTLVHERPIDWPTPYDVILVYGEPKKDEWVDDEAEKSAKKAAAEKKAAEEAAQKKEEEEEAAQRAKMMRQVQMMKMMEEMDAEGAATQAGGGKAPPTGVEGAIPPP